MTEKEMILNAFERTNAEIIKVDEERNYYEIRPMISFETIGLTFDDEDKLIRAII
jgi:hypothetical protein